MQHGSELFTNSRPGWTRSGVLQCDLFALIYLREFISTGKPFMHPDGSAVVYNPPAGRIPQQGKTPLQPLPAASQQPANHVHSQVSGVSFIPFFIVFQLK